MHDDKRKHPRHEVHVDVQLSFLAYEPTPAATQDISKGGMFLKVENSSNYEVGEMTHLKYNDPFSNDRVTMIGATVVRIASDGIGISFPEPI